MPVKSLFTRVRVRIVEAHEIFVEKSVNEQAGEGYELKDAHFITGLRNDLGILLTFQEVPDEAADQTNEAL